MQYHELDLYFRARYEELLNKKTPDSYRVRNHNVLSILQELCEMIDGWQKRKIQSPETVILCAQECKTLMEDDQWIDYSFYDKKLFLRDVEEYIKVIPDSKDKRESAFEISSKLKYACRKCEDYNSNLYANNLFSYLIGEINKEGDMDADRCYVEELHSFDKALSFLCRELIRLGYSKNYLYINARKLHEGSISIETLKTQLLPPSLIKHVVVYKFQGNSYIENCRAEYGFTNNIDDIVQWLSSKKAQQIKAFINSDGGMQFWKFEVEALDIYSAIKKAKGEMSLLLDTLHLGNDSNIGKPMPNVLVLWDVKSGGRYSRLLNLDYQLDGTYNSNPEMSMRLKVRMDAIKSSKLVKDDVKERLSSALRHLRMANYCDDIDLRFVNYWVALEFIFSSPISYENTFVRIKKHLIDVLSYSYVARNVNYLDNLLHKDGALDVAQSLVEMSEADWGKLINKVTDKRTQYRLCKMKSHLHSGQDILGYISSHRKNLEWHIVRIYRMRNELIHEAALKQDIEETTSNLRFYLVFLLNQLVSYFYSAKMPVSINDFFHEYENKTKTILSNTSREYILKAKYETGLIC